MLDRIRGQKPFLHALAENTNGGSADNTTKVTGNDKRNRSTISKTKPQESPNTVDIYAAEYVICGQIKYKGVCEKFRISECYRAEIYFKAIVCYENEVYTRTCDLQDIQSVFGQTYCVTKTVLDHTFTSMRGIQNRPISPQNFTRLTWLGNLL